MLPADLCPVRHRKRRDHAARPQIASFREHEFGRVRRWLSHTPEDEVAEVFFGFALASPTHNIIALRGTQSVDEWIEDLDAIQISYSLAHPERGFVHAGFHHVYDKLADQVRSAAGQFDTSLPCYVTGHSLGAAVAVLAAADIALNVAGLKDRLRLYNYACPRVGSPAFSTFYAGLVPASYRVVNLADVVPIIVPPSRATVMKCVNVEYRHVGQEWSYLNQTGDIGGNHFMQENYLPAVQQGVESDQPRRFPSSGA